MMEPIRENPPTFEDTYPLYAFAELVRLGVLLGHWLARARLRHGTERTDPIDLAGLAKPQPSPG